jgi:hypothetical protein
MPEMTSITIQIDEVILSNSRHTTDPDHRKIAYVYPINDPRTLQKGSLIFPTVTNMRFTDCSCSDLCLFSSFFILCFLFVACSSLHFPLSFKIV